jgi:hypothetical protein
MYAPITNRPSPITRAPEGARGDRRAAPSFPCP